MVWAADSLHLFTKDLLGRDGRDMAYHFVLPAAPGDYLARLADSIRLPRRSVTAAALDVERNTLVLAAYNFRRLLGFLPSSSASLIAFTDFRGTDFFSGRRYRRNISWAVPSQFEAVDFAGDHRYVYVATEGNPFRPRARVKRLKHPAPQMKDE